MYGATLTIGCQLLLTVMSWQLLKILLHFSESRNIEATKDCIRGLCQMLNMTLQEPCESMQSDHKSIDTEQNTQKLEVLISVFYILLTPLAL